MLFVDMQLVEAFRKHEMLAKSKETYGNYKSIVHLQQVQPFYGGPKGRQPMLITDEQRTYQSTPAVRSISVFCHREMTAHLLRIKEAESAENRVLKFDQELGRLFVVGLWSVACSKHKDQEDQAKVDACLEQLRKTMNAVFESWDLRLRLTDRKVRALLASHDLMYMNSAYRICKI